MFSHEDRGGEDRRQPNNPYAIVESGVPGRTFQTHMHVKTEVQGKRQEIKIDGTLSSYSKLVYSSE